VPSTATPSTIPAKFVYLLNADDITVADTPKNAFVVYQGHHGDCGAHLADVILPGLAYTEKDATFVSTEGRTQMTRAAVAAPGASRADWQIIRALSEVTGKALPYDNIDGLRYRMAQIAPNLMRHDTIETAAFPDLGIEVLAASAGATAKTPTSIPLSHHVIENFYQTDPISRASTTMAQCTAAFVKGQQGESANASSGATTAQAATA
jgi:NADH dehydrogenase (ubiquinone) Fe-S protein 1